MHPGPKAGAVECIVVVAIAGLEFHAFGCQIAALVIDAVGVISKLTTKASAKPGCGMVTSTI
jgi:hypothetical protein